MIRRILNYLRELYWFRLIAVTLVFVAFIAMFYSFPVSGLALLGAIVFAILSLQIEP